MGNFLKMTDLVQFSLIDDNLIKVKDDYEGAFKPDLPERAHPSGMGTQPSGFSAEQQQMPGMGPGLQVRIAASHAGIITRNNGFYLPDKMKKGSGTFVSDYPKPVLLHHADHNDPVGRVIASAYVDTSGAIQDRYAGKTVKDKNGKEIGVITDSLIKDFVSDKMPFGQQVDIVRTLLRDTLLEDTSYDGLGHIEIVANVSDKDSIEKLLDGRYLTGSVGATTDKAVCSVCRTDWTDSGKCEHTPGGMYDGAKCFIIAGNLIYDEYSFVNVPADRHSKVLELNYNGIQDSIEVVEEYSGRIYEVRLSFPQYDSATSNKEEGRMSLKDSKKEGQDATEPKAGDLEVKIENAEGAEDTSKVTDDTTPEGDKLEDETTPKAGAEGEETVVQDDKNEEGETVEQLAIRVLDSDDVTLTDEEEVKLYNYMWEEVLASVKDGALVLTDELLEEAKLSADARKKLPKSSFCGPGKSFPVSDCAHIIAAGRLVNRLELSDTAKAKALEVVTRKAKVKDCIPGKATDSVEQIQESMQHAHMMRMLLSTLEENSYSNEEVLTDEEKSMLQAILVRMAKCVGKDSFVAAAQEAELAQDESQLLDEVATLETTVGDLQDRLAASQKEYNLLFRDMEGLQDELTASHLSTRQAREENLKTLMALHDHKVEEVDFTELSDSEVADKLVATAKSVDMVKITDKLGDGMSRVPADGETVDNPVDIRDSKIQKREVTVEDLAQIEEEYLKILFRDGAVAANTFKRQMMIEGRLPQDSE